MHRVPVLCFVALLSLPNGAWPQGDPIGPEFRVNTFTTGNQGDAFFPSAVAADPTGNFVVVWSSTLQDGSSGGLFGQRYASSGSPLGPEFRVNTYTTGHQYTPSVAADASGNFIVVWASDQDGSLFGIFGQRYASSGAPLGPEFRVNTYTTSRQLNPDVAADVSGNFVVVWSSDQDGSTYGVFGQRYAGTGASLGGEFRVNSYTTFRQRFPAVASDSTGNFIVVWDSENQDGSREGVFAQRYASSGSPLGVEFRVNTHTTGRQGRVPSVAADASGNFVVGWGSEEQDGSSYGVFGQRYASSGVPLGPEFRVNTSTLASQHYPTVAADASGNFVVAWHSPGGNGYFDIFGQRYASSGVPLGPEFGVNSYLGSNQILPALTSNAAGHFVVVWRSYLQDGSAWGIFGQRYSMIVPVELMQFRVE